MNEKEICEDLKKWFEQNGIQCWLNQGDNKFSTKLSQKKPDIIIFSDELHQYIAIEVKNGDIDRLIYDGSKIIEYLSDCVENRIEYYINDTQITISTFAIATQYSKYGKLFESDKYIEDGLLTTNNSWKKCLKEWKLEPRFEYIKTHQFIRNLWSRWRVIRKKTDKIGIGLILSDSLNKDLLDRNIVDKPIIFRQHYGKIFNQDKEKWKVQQKLL